MRLFLIISIIMYSLSSSAQNFFLFVGTYTGKGSKGIYVYRFDASSGEARWVSNTDSVVNPSYLAISPNGKYVYAVNETGGSEGGKVSAFSFDRSTGSLSFINQQITGGDHPCYLAVAKDGNWVSVANYTGGSIALFRTGDKGSLKPYTQLIQHTGSSSNKERQEKAHVHATVFSPKGDYLFTPDLGMDRVMVYRFDPGATTPLIPAQHPFEATKPGSGPRHFTFHPNGKWAYLMEELSGNVSLYTWEGSRLHHVQEVSAHPKGYKGMVGSADIHLSPNGKYLYASNRGDANSIAIFSVGPSGKLTWVREQAVLGIKPRNFIIDPTGTFLLVANQDTNNIVIFKRDPKTGLLSATGKQIEVPNPVCLQLLK